MRDNNYVIGPKTEYAKYQVGLLNYDWTTKAGYNRLVNVCSYN